MQAVQKASRVRYSILAAVFVNVVINYMDRSNISVAGLQMSKELHLDNISMGYVFSSFAWTYASLQIPGSMMVDRYGARILYAITLTGWSLATFALGWVQGFFLLILLRVLIGVFEAPSYPMNNQIVTSWFPVHERASAIAVYTSGQFLGLAFLTPLLFMIQASAGWRGLFFITGIVGMLWGIAWYFFYRNPREHHKVNKAELEYLEKGGAVFDDSVSASQKKFQWNGLVQVLSRRKLWGIYIGQFCIAGTTSFFITWFPKYLVEFRKMDFIKSGLYVSVPFLFAFMGVLFSGFLSDWLVRKNISAGIARKTPVITGLALAITILFANYVTAPGWVIFFMSLAFFGNGLASITWVFVSLLAPRNLMGITGGAFNFMGGLASIFIPVIIGYLARNGDFAPAVIFISCLALTGALSYILVVGKVERIVIDSPGITIN